MGVDALPLGIGSIIDSTRFSTCGKLLRVSALVLRFIKRVQRKVRAPVTVFPSIQELEEAKALWIKHVQQKCYADIIDALHNKKPHTLIHSLGLWLDGEGMIRCGGRLMKSALQSSAVHPILLPKVDYFTTLVIDFFHRHLLHSGVAHTLAQIRHEYWIPSGRSAVFKFIRTCLPCHKVDGGPFRAPQMPSLLKERVTSAPPFTWTGLDYFGPLMVKESNNEKRKVWICIFTCMATRAIHLEVVPDMTAEHFLIGLRRFIARRGAPSHIISDNALKFKLVSSTLDRAWKPIREDLNVMSYVNAKHISWSYIPEYAPWMGGFYERLIHSVKQALRKSIRRICLHYVQLETIILEIEAVLNTRPLTYVGSDFKDGFALTPAHLLSANPKLGTPAIEVEDPTDPEFVMRLNSSKRLLQTWATGQQHLQAFWKQWRDQYLLDLRNRPATWTKHPKRSVPSQPKVGEVVHIKADVPRGSWQLARIVELIGSHDGEVRSAKVIVPSGKIFTRATIHLYPLEPFEPTTSQTDSSLEVADAPMDNTSHPICQPRPKRQAAADARAKIKQHIEEEEDWDLMAPVHTPKPPYHSFSLFPCIALAIIAICFLPTAHAFQPLLCEAQHAKIAFDLSSRFPCTMKTVADDSKHVQPGNILIYKRNLARYTSQHCQMVLTKSPNGRSKFS